MAKRKNNNAWRVDNGGTCYHIPTHMALVPVKEAVATATVSFTSKSKPKSQRFWFYTQLIIGLGMVAIVMATM